jgi:uncharacterized membrane protein
MNQPPHPSKNSTDSGLPTDLPFNPNPYIEPVVSGPTRQVLALRLSAPFYWLRLGLSDLRFATGIALFYGVCFWLMALMLAFVFSSSPEYTLSIASGCLLAGPFLAMGLYEVSRCRERGHAPNLASSLTCWDSHLPSMGMLMLVLIVLELLWGRASLLVFAVFFNTGMPSTTHVLQAVLNPENLEFLLVYLAVGSVFAGLVFSSMVIALPMILDRDTDAVTAVIASFDVVYQNTGVMLLWGLLISTLVFVAMIPWGFGLILVGPWLGHASWHAYRSSLQWTQADLP